MITWRRANVRSPKETESLFSKKWEEALSLNTRVSQGM